MEGGLIQLSPLLECDPTVFLPEKSGNPKEIPTWASRVSNYSYFPWFNRQQTWRSAKGSSLYILYRIFSQSRRYSITWCLMQKYSIISLGFPRERWTLLWDLTISGWPNEWINITWQCFIKSNSRYLYEYIIYVIPIKYVHIVDRLEAK
jgi:hypothetical protein